MSPKDITRAVDRASRRLKRHVRTTPLEPSPTLSDRAGADVFLKLENLQHTGSFKFRGAMNKLLSLTPKARSRGVVAASSGNHGLAVAAAGRNLDVATKIFLPTAASKAKVLALRRQGADVSFFGADCLATELHARAQADQSDRTYVSPYNDIEVIAGQGTLGLEMWNPTAPLDAIFLAVGGGGLISGVAASLKARHPRLQVIGCLPKNSPHMARSIAAGRILDLPTKPTLSDGTAGGLEPNALTFELCHQLVDRWVLVTEREIAQAMRLILADHHFAIEGAAGVAVAGLLKVRRELDARRIGVVLCGSNVTLDTLRHILTA